MIRIVLETMPQFYRVTIFSVRGLKETLIVSDVHTTMVSPLEALRQTILNVSDYIRADQPETPEHT